MGFLDHQDTGHNASTKKIEVVAPELEICIDGENWIPINKHSVDKVYSDAMPGLIIVVDEIAELTQKGGLKTTEGKAEDAQKDEIISNIQSITQLGRSSHIHCILCTQRNDAALADFYELTVMRNNQPINIKWEDLQIGDVFADGAQCTKIGDWFNDTIYKVFINDDVLIASAGHLLKIDIQSGNEFSMKINDLLELPRSVEARKGVNEPSTDWVSVEDLYRIQDHFNFYSNGKLITNIEKLNENRVRCIQTNTGRYLIKDFISHNSVIPGIIQNNPLSIDTLVEVKE